MRSQQTANSYQLSAVSGQKSGFLKRLCAESRTLNARVLNEKGIALVMVLILSAISLAIMAGLLYMVVTGTQISGMQKRYNTALEAGTAGIDVTYQVIAARIDNPATLQTNFNFLTNFVVTASQTCLNNKLLMPTSAWNAACNSLLTIDPTVPSTYDMSFDLGTYTAYAKIVDTVEGNSGGDEGLLKHGVVSAGSGEITVMSIPYLYTIEVNAEATTNPAERAKLSILYQY